MIERWTIRFLLGIVLSGLLSANAATWQTLEGAHFRVHYDRDVRDAQRVLRLAEELYANIAEKLPLPGDAPVDIWLTYTPEAFASLRKTPIRGWEQGYAIPSERKIVLRMPEGPGRIEALEQLTRHEVAHASLGLLTGGRVETVPHWFHEGFAMYVSEPWTLWHEATLFGAAIFRRTIPLDDLRDGFPSDGYDAKIAYAVSFGAVRSLVFDYSFSQFRTLIERIAEGEPFEEAFTAVFGVTPEMFAFDWQRSATRRFEWLGLIGGLAALGALFTPILLFGYVRRRRERRQALDAWAREEEKPDAFFR